MIFLKPTADIVFKRLFGTVKNKHILISFLNSILERKDEHKIVDVTFLDPYNNPDTGLDKLSIVDVRCQDQDGKQYIIEVQVATQRDYASRVLHYVGRAFSEQLRKGDDFGKVLPVIFIGIIDFELFTTPGGLSHHFVMNKDSGEHSIKLVEFHFIELPKFSKTIEELETDTEKWIFFLKNAKDLTMVPSELKNPTEVKDALDELNQGTWSKVDLIKYEKIIDAERVAKSVLRTAEEIGREAGLLEGKLETAKKMLEKGMSIDVVCEVTGLSIDEIKKT